MRYGAKSEITGSHGRLGRKEKVEIVCRGKTPKHPALGSQGKQESNGSVGETAKTGGHDDPIWKAEFCDLEFTQSWAVRNRPECL